MQKIYYILIVSVLFWSCDVPIALDLKQTSSKIVIEGLITNKSAHQYVKVSRTNDFYAEGKTPRISNAIVSVKDDLNNTFIFNHNPNQHKDSTGYYLPSNSFTGEIGRTYTLTVVVDGTTYTAQDKMFSVTTIDSLAYEVNKDVEKDPKEAGKIYEVLIFTNEPQATKDYYLFKFYRNDSIKFDSENDIYYSDDEFLGENIDGVPSPNYYGVGDTARVEAYSLTKNGFIFYADLQKLIRNDGGLFSSPPANSRTNLDNGAVGFFQVSALEEREVVIE